MNKYKIVGGINIFLGLAQIIIAFVIPFFVMQKLKSMYETFEDNLQSPSGIYPILLVIGLIGVANIFVGLKGFKDTGSKNYKISIAMLIVSFILTPFLIGTLNMLIITPIYALMGQF